MKRFLIIYTAVIAVFYHVIAFVSADYYWYELMYNGIGEDVSDRIVVLCGLFFGTWVAGIINHEINIRNRRN